MDMTNSAIERKWTTKMQEELYELLCCLHQLGRDFPQLLIHLTEIVYPSLPQERRIPVLGKMFEDIPLLLEDEHKLEKLCTDPPSDFVTLRLLLSFRDLSRLVQQISYLQLLHLTNNLIPPGSIQTQLEFFLKAQEVFQSWSPEILQQHHQVLAETPLHMERQQLLQLEPLIPWELLHFLIELLKLPLGELFNLQDWLSKLPKKQVLLLLQLLQLEPPTLLELKQRIDAYIHQDTLTAETTEATPSTLSLASTTPSTTATTLSLSAATSIPHTIIKQEDNMSIESGHSWHNGSAVVLPQFTNSGTPMILPTPPTSLQYPMQGMIPQNMNMVMSPHAMNPTVKPVLMTSTDSIYNFQLRIARQPPAKTVYQRILKPFPAVMLVVGNMNGDVTATNNLFVEASLLRSDSDVELPLCIEGTKVVRISNGVFATFKKLKILSTSQQQGTLFRLKFTLKRYIGNIFEQLPNTYVISNPIEVFSHTLYLYDKQEAPPPPIVHEVLPPSGKVGTRCVVLGSNFVNNPLLRVRFGDVEVTPTFHEQGTLICIVPPFQKHLCVPILVTNDGINYCQDSKVSFTYTAS